ncbi:uncharacterized protein [Macrobrachium rosenbergii]|uniref:uncharacterized protein n=1 Tax=Macrobrachium rosenbergii TaxID=79674 RepID=UPI0034D7AC90
MRTGGGAPPKPEDEETAKILSIIGDDLDGEENELDCDAVQSTGQPHTVIGIRNDGHECEITFDTQIMGQHTNNSVDSIETPPKLSEFNTAQSTPAGKVSSQKANTSRDTPTSIQLNTTDITSQCTQHLANQIPPQPESADELLSSLKRPASKHLLGCSERNIR